MVCCYDSRTKMKGKTRWFLAVSVILLLAFCHYFLCYVNDLLRHHLKYPSWTWRKGLPRGLGATYISSIKGYGPAFPNLLNSVYHNNGKANKFDSTKCRMETCFNFSKCRGKNRPFKVYVYPQDIFGGQPAPSENYAKVHE